MVAILSSKQREGAEALWRAVSERQECVLGIAYRPGTDCELAVRRQVATTVALLEPRQLDGLIVPECAKYGPVRRDYVWRWSPIALRQDIQWTL